MRQWITQRRYLSRASQAPTTSVRTQRQNCFSSSRVREIRMAHLASMMIHNISWGQNELNHQSNLTWSALRTIPSQNSCPTRGDTGLLWRPNLIFMTSPLRAKSEACHNSLGILNDFSIDSSKKIMRRANSTHYPASRTSIDQTRREERCRSRRNWTILWWKRVRTYSRLRRFNMLLSNTKRCFSRINPW